MIKHIIIGSCVLAFLVVSVGAVTHAQVTAPAATPDSPASDRPAFKRIATVQQLMLAIVEPQSNTVFRVEVEAPHDLRGWNTISNAALALAEAGNLLMLPGRPEPFQATAHMLRGDSLRHLGEPAEAVAGGLAVRADPRLAPLAFAHGWRVQEGPEEGAEKAVIRPATP